VRERASRVLYFAGESARAALEEALSSKDPEARHRAEALLLSLRWRAAAPESLAARIPDLARRLMEAEREDLARLLRDLHVAGVAEALPALRFIVLDERRMAGLEDALERAPLAERIAVQSAIAAYACPEGESLVVALANGPNAILRRGAVEALGRLESAAARSALEGLARHPDPETAAAALRALERTGRPPEAAFLEALATNAREPEPKRTEAIRSLAARGDRRAVPVLVSLLGDPEVGGEAAAALAAFRAPEAVAPLLERLGPPDDAALLDRHLHALARCGGDSVASYVELVLGSRLASDTARAAIFAGLGPTRDAGVARRALHEIARDGASDFLVVEALEHLAPLPDADVVPVLARRLETDAPAPRALALALSGRGAAGREALREIGARAGADDRCRAAALAALARVSERKDRDLARKHAHATEPFTRGAALFLLASSDPSGSRDAVSLGLDSLRRGRGAFRPGLPDALRAMGALRRPDDGPKIVEIALGEASLAVSIGALEALCDAGDRAAARRLVESKGVPLRLVAAEEIARRGLRADADLLTPLLDDGAPSASGVRARDREPSVFSVSPREVATRALEALFPDAAAGGVDPASRAAAWKTFLDRRAGRER